MTCNRSAIEATVMFQGTRLKIEGTWSPLWGLGRTVAMNKNPQPNQPQVSLLVADMDGTLVAKQKVLTEIERFILGNNGSFAAIA